MPKIKAATKPIPAASSSGAPQKAKKEMEKGQIKVKEEEEGGQIKVKKEQEDVSKVEAKKEEEEEEDELEIVEIIEAPVRQKQRSARKQSLGERVDDSEGQKTTSNEERKPQEDQNMEDDDRVRIEMQRNDFICYKCNKVFPAKQRYNIMGHIKSKHLDMKSRYEKDSESEFTRCPFCPFECGKQMKLILHINDEHYKKDSNAIVTIIAATEEAKATHNVSNTAKQTFDSSIDGSTVQNPKPKPPGITCYKCSQWITIKHNLPMHIKATHLKLARDATLPEGKCPFCPFEHAKQSKIFFHINEAHYKQPSDEQSTASPGPKPSQEVSLAPVVSQLPSFASGFLLDKKPSKDPSKDTEKPVKEKRKYTLVTCFKCGKSMPPLGGFTWHIKYHLNLGKDEPLDRDAAQCCHEIHLSDDLIFHYGVVYSYLT